MSRWVSFGLFSVEVTVTLFAGRAPRKNSVSTLWCVVAGVWGLKASKLKYSSGGMEIGCKKSVKRKHNWIWISEPRRHFIPKKSSLFRRPNSAIVVFVRWGCFNTDLTSYYTTNYLSRTYLPIQMLSTLLCCFRRLLPIKIVNEKSSWSIIMDTTTEWKLFLLVNDRWTTVELDPWSINTDGAQDPPKAFHWKHTSLEYK